MSVVRRTPCEEATALGIGLLAAAWIAAAGWMLAAPESFVASIGPAGAPGADELRGTAALAAAQGVGLTIALLRPALRTAVLTTSVAALALLTTDRWIDITGGDVPAGAGSLDAGLSTLGLALTAALAFTARRCHGRPTGVSDYRSTDRRTHVLPH